MEDDYTRKAFRMANRLCDNDGAISGAALASLRQIVRDKRFLYLPSSVGLTLSNAFIRAMRKS